MGGDKKVVGKVVCSFFSRRLWKGGIFLFIILLFIFGGLSAYGYSYRNRVLPGVFIGNISISGMSVNELQRFLQRMDDKLMNEGMKFKYSAKGKEKKLVVYPLIASEGNSLELVDMDLKKEADRLAGFGKSKNIFLRGFNAILGRCRHIELSIKNIKADREKLEEILKINLSAYESLPAGANVEVLSISPLDYRITSSTPGIVFLYDEAVDEAVKAWSRFELLEINVKMENRNPGIVEADAIDIVNRIPSVFDDGPIFLSYTDQHTRIEYGWQITEKQIKDWLAVQKTDAGAFGFGLDREKLNEYLKDNIESKVNVEAKDAKFRMGQDGKAVEFQGSRPGISMDVEKTADEINQAILDRTWHDEGAANAIQISVNKMEPNIKTSDVNNLGIREILGTGISNYAGSPKNRIKNIRNAVNKLNGVLIKPGDEFSALKYTAPFTGEGGYLSELVIKGDEIKPEVGGGLCQIGTTLFRMAMNSGMLITARRNHSLVVNYYNDPSNGKPGTDATVYDPAPDFRFKNDTGNYLLIQTSMDAEKQELAFTLWGTSDGRKGYYSHPVVTRWISFGEKRVVETTKLKPGEEKCQHPYKGADASFTYTREFANGTKEDTVFESHYRALPKICLVGVEEKPEEIAPESESPQQTATDILPVVE